MIQNCIARGKYFSITAPQNGSVLEAIKSIPEDQWSSGYMKDQIKAGWEYAQTNYYLGAKKNNFRLVVKRHALAEQSDLFTDYKYWVIASNLLEEQYSALEVIHFHQLRGAMEKVIGELKHHFGLGSLPCGQFHANALYFSTGVLAYNLLQAIKIIALPPECRKQSVKILRYQLLHLAGRIVYHARYMVMKLTAPLKNIRMLEQAYLRLSIAPQ